MIENKNGCSCVTPWAAAWRAAPITPRKTAAVPAASMFRLSRPPRRARPSAPPSLPRAATDPKTPNIRPNEMGRISYYNVISGSCPPGAAYRSCPRSREAHALAGQVGQRPGRLGPGPLSQTADDSVPGASVSSPERRARCRRTCRDWRWRPPRRGYRPRSRPGTASARARPGSMGIHEIALFKQPGDLGLGLRIGAEAGGELRADALPQLRRHLIFSGGVQAAHILPPPGRRCRSRHRAAAPDCWRPEYPWRG